MSGVVSYSLKGIDAEFSKGAAARIFEPILSARVAQGELEYLHATKGKKTEIIQWCQHRASPTIRQFLRSLIESIVYILNTLTDFLNPVESVLGKGGILKDEGTHLLSFFNIIPNIFLNLLPGVSHRL